MTARSAAPSCRHRHRRPGRYTIANVTAYERLPDGSGVRYRFLRNAYPVVLTHGALFTDLPVVHNSWSGNQPPRPCGSSDRYGAPCPSRLTRVRRLLRRQCGLRRWNPGPARDHECNRLLHDLLAGGHGPDPHDQCFQDRLNLATRDIVGGYDRVFNFELTRR